MLGDFFFIPYKNRFLSLLFFKNGLVQYSISVEGHRFFQYFHLVPKRNRRFYKFSIYYNVICFIKKLSLLSMIEIVGGRGGQYCRAVGSKSRLFSIDKANEDVLVELPSKLKKTFYIFSVCAIGRVMGEEYKFWRNTKSGYWRGFGRKGCVRGVATNPVDHPHGGRTKSIKYPRTP